VTHNPETRWWPITVAFLAGCFGAAQIGKVAASLSIVIDDLGLSLVEGGLMVSLFTLTTALGGALFGLLGDRYGHLVLAVTGLLISAAGAFAGAEANSVTTLLATRFVEGVGFTLAIVCLPPLISQMSSHHDRPLAMGLWGAFMPGGMALIMLVSPWLISLGGWRGQWSVVGWVLLLWALLLWLTFRRTGVLVSGDARSLLTIGAAMLRPGPLLLFGCFACYSAMYVPLTAFFTTLLVNQSHLSVELAAWIVAPVVAANIIGNLAAGWLVRRGVMPHRLQMLAFIVMGLGACLVFASFTPVIVKVVAGFMFSAFGGLIPGTLFIMAPGFASRPAQIAALSGLLLQGAGIGQTLGPLAVGAAVERLGDWGYASVTMVVASAAGWYLGHVLGRDRFTREAR
jgi:MFS transporter, CP family, cyanate transporter